MSELPEVELLLDILAANAKYGWEHHRTDSVYLYLKNTNGKNPPHVRIRRDTGMVECLNGISFQVGDTKIGWRMTCRDFVDVVMHVAGL